MKSKREGRSRRGALSRALAIGAVLTAGSLVGDAAAQAAAIHIHDVKLTAPTEETAEIVVATSGTPRFSARVTDGGKRLLIDLEGADVQGAPGAITRGNRLVGGVMTQTFQAGAQRTTRVLVQLARPVGYRVRAEAGSLVMSFKAADQTGPIAAPATPTSPASPAPSAPSASSEAPAKATAEEAPHESGPTVSDVRFDHRAGHDRIILEMSAIPSFSQTSPAPGPESLLSQGQTPFTGAITAGGCGPKHAFSITDDKTQVIQVVVAAVNTANDITINYELEGPSSADLIVLVNGLADDRTTWSSQIPAFLKANYQILSFDNRGIGQTSRPQGPYTAELLAEDLHALLKHLTITSAHFVGVSMGGMILQAYALKFPNGSTAAQGVEMKSLVLASTSPVLGQRGIPPSTPERKSLWPLCSPQKLSQPKSILCSAVGMISSPRSALSASEARKESTSSAGSRWSHLISWVRWRLGRVLGEHGWFESHVCYKLQSP